MNLASVQWNLDTTKCQVTGKLCSLYKRGFVISRFFFIYINCLYSRTYRYKEQGAKKIIFTACHSGKLKLAFTSPDVIWTSPKSFLTSRIDFTVLPLFELLKNNTCPSGKLKTEFTTPIAKSTSPGLSDTTFFALWGTSIQRSPRFNERLIIAQ